MKNFLIDLLAFAALFSSVLVITSKNPVIAVIFLISVFVNAAGYLILLGIGFIGISYIIVYVGAIAVLFLFVIMLLNIKLTDILETGSQYTKNLPLALSIGILFIYEIYTIIPFPFDNVSFISYLLNLINIFNGLLLKYNFNLDNIIYIANNPSIADTAVSSFTQIEAIGQGLYTYGASWLIITSVILLLAMIAPIFISRGISKKVNKLNPFKCIKFKEFDRKFKKIAGKRYYHSSPIINSAFLVNNNKIR
uniref:NADH dehydrogenase subunit 6 n=1 Tax=Daedalea confragosa TaxID=2028083 RepID=UPI002A8364CA|nr:NADH dehydrogenase subunit 6 [Daedaleopsis confragosa]YP_011031320.1 NADH dehydrogenase subunit 6 [Daedaleopsis sinensis]WNZ34391.1 NADH dehydrogenase subunit 6 [Daedaleopsis confragosa]WQT73186.1 NADH dehydrogenase subunit 6 [Daedaleopsis sinensis]